MIYTFDAIFSENINRKILPLAITAMQQLVVTNKVSDIMDTFLSNAPSTMKAKKKYIMDTLLTIMYDEYFDDPLSFVQVQKMLENETIMEAVDDSRFSEGSSRVGGPTWTTVERRDPDGYVRKFLFGVLIKGKIIDNKLILHILEEERRNVWGGKMRRYITKFLRSFSAIKKILLYYNMLKNALGGMKYDNIKDVYTYKKVMLDEHGFIFLGELDILNAFGEDFTMTKFGKLQKIGWQNFVLDISSEQSIIYWGKFSGRGMIVIPYRTLISQISDRFTVDEYLDIRDKSKQLFKYNISVNRGIKLIKKALDR